MNRTPRMDGVVVVRFFPDYGYAWPLWFPAGERDDSQDRLSPAVQERLWNWVVAWEDGIDFSRPLAELGKPDELALLRHLVEGYRLAALVQQELGDGYRVIAEHDHGHDPWRDLG